MINSKKLLSKKKIYRLYLIVFFAIISPVSLTAQHGSGGLSALGSFVEEILISLFIKLPIIIIIFLNLLALVRKNGKSGTLNMLTLLLSLLLISIINTPPYLLQENTIFGNIILSLSISNLLFTMLFRHKKTNANTQKYNQENDPRLKMQNHDEVRRKKDLIFELKDDEVLIMDLDSRQMQKIKLLEWKNLKNKSENKTYAIISDYHKKKS